MNIIFVCNEELKGAMQGYSLCLLGNELKFQLNCSRSDVNERAQLLRKNFSRNFRSIRSGPSSSNGTSVLWNATFSLYSVIIQRYTSGQNYGLNLYLHPCVLCMRTTKARASLRICTDSMRPRFARKCEKYQNRTCWLKATH